MGWGMGGAAAQQPAGAIFPNPICQADSNSHSKLPVCLGSEQLQCLKVFEAITMPQHI